MPVYEYVALDTAGRSRKGIVNADSPRLARQKLRTGGLYTSSLRESEVETKDRRGAWYHLDIGSRRVRRSDMVSATRTLSTLLGAGLPLVSALSGILDQEGGTGMDR